MCRWQSEKASVLSRIDPPLLSKNDPGSLLLSTGTAARAPRDRLPPFSVTVLICCEPEVYCAPERSRLPSRAGASGSHHLPWALPRILHVRARGKRPAGGNVGHDGRGCGSVCSKGASSVFNPGERASGIAAPSAGRGRGNGRSGRTSNDTGKRQRADRNAMAKAGATGNGSRPGNHQSQRQLAWQRG
jgi:hypothetical protein